MIRIVSYTGQPVDELLNRASVPTKNVTQAVQSILDDVRARGNEAALEYSKKFDGASLTALTASTEEIEAGAARVDAALTATMARAVSPI